jgi:hypothetical protein
MANPDSTLLSWITAEVNQALAGVRDQIAKFSANAGNTAVLHGCSDHLHQVSGALRMVGLSGATRFSEAIEASCRTHRRSGAQTMGLIDGGARPEGIHRGLERGQPNLPLRLFPVYRVDAGQAGPEQRDRFSRISRSRRHILAAKVPAEDLAASSRRNARNRARPAGWLRHQPGGLDGPRRRRRNASPHSCRSPGAAVCEGTSRSSPPSRRRASARRATSSTSMRDLAPNAGAQ